MQIGINEVPLLHTNRDYLKEKALIQLSSEFFHEILLLHEQNINK